MNCGKSRQTAASGHGTKLSAGKLLKIKSLLIIVFIGKLLTWKFIPLVLLSLSHQLNYLEIWSLRSKLPQEPHSANGRKPSVSETRGLVSSCPP